MKIKFNRFDNKILKKANDETKLGYFLTCIPYALYDGLRALCKKYHIELQDGAEIEVMKLIAKQLES